MLVNDVSSLKLRILLCVVWLAILAIVTLAINYNSASRESPEIAAIAIATPTQAVTSTPIADPFPAATPDPPPSFVGQLISSFQ